MNDLLLEFLKISLGIVVGGVVTTPFKVLKAYNSTQLSINSLEQKLENLTALLQHWERGFMESKLRAEKVEVCLMELERRLLRAETLLESVVESRRNPD